MRESRKSNNLSTQLLLSDRKLDALQQVVDQEYHKLFRQTQTSAKKTVRHILRHVARYPPPRLLTTPIPKTSQELDDDDDDPYIQTRSVTITNGANQKPQKYSTAITVLPTVSAVRELIAYVPTMKNLAMRGILTGIPYLGDKFDDEDQKLINSISGESEGQTKMSIRKNKLDGQSLELLYHTIRSSQTCELYTNEQIIDAILHYHRDSSPKPKLLAIASQNECSTNSHPLHSVNIDTSDTIDIDIDDLCIKPWCSRFCTRCYTYNCLLHKDSPSYLPLPEKFSLTIDAQSSPCCPTCYKHQREQVKRPLSPSYTNDEHNPIETYLPTATGNVRKRPRKSIPVRRILSPNQGNLSHNENFRVDQYHLQMSDIQKKLPSQQLLTRIENHMLYQQSTLMMNSWTLTDRSLFRLFYFLLDGDLCTIKQFFHTNRTCRDLYEQFISDTKYFSERISLVDGQPLTIRQVYRRRMVDGATRAFLFHIKKHLNETNASNAVKSVYIPCQHEGPCAISNKNCQCMKNGTYCEKYCNCSIDCPHRFPGCSCKGACLLNNCLCCAEGRECDPDLCHKCGASSFPNLTLDYDPMIKSEPEVIQPIVIERKSLPSLPRQTYRTKVHENIPMRQHSVRSCRVVEPSYKTSRTQTKRSSVRISLNSNSSSNTPAITCANIGLQRKQYKQILIAESDVAGYGAFLGSPVAYPGDLIAEYTGEIITEEEADRRGRLYDKQACSYLFNLDTDRCVDARQFGSKIRFANHSSTPNCVPKIKLVNGDYRIGIYAKQTIFQGDELFFEYMYDAHHRQQFVNNERVDDSVQDRLTILKRYGDNFMLVRPSYD
ncbi:unnamed protein product [Adineta ricciae]|uniref:[histone H3]-lysine(27) N-trimethyltransferase n=1 Tax=Adineta ricciae TaxID=249248 RepID=A0A814N5E8_ADIRI|nr:unnamed protein product [Adineta ricciae]CAF1160730.1 unnamed protein product [Adineta ricciae]